MISNISLTIDGDVPQDSVTEAHRDHHQVITKVRDSGASWNRRKHCETLQDDLWFVDICPWSDTEQYSDCGRS